MAAVVAIGTLNSNCFVVTAETSCCFPLSLLLLLKWRQVKARGLDPHSPVGLGSCPR